MSRLYPDVDEYHLYYAQSLYKSGQYEPAAAACLLVNSNEFSQQKLKLQAAIRFQLQDISGCRMLIDKSDPSDPDTFINKGVLLFKVRKTTFFKKYRRVNSMRL